VEVQLHELTFALYWGEWSTSHSSSFTPGKETPLRNG